MAKRKIANSLSDSFWDFVQEHPDVAAAIAFQLGAVAAQAVQGSTAARLRKNGESALRALAKGVHDAPGAVAATLPDMPDLAKLTGLKFLPGPSPKLQPRSRKRTASQHSKKARKAA